MQTLDILDRLIAFPTVSRDPNIALITYVAKLLGDAGIKTRLVPNDTGTKANLYASTGPDIPGGVLLSGHTDVVPVEGQAWTKDPFKLTRENGNLYGRGTADMKGFCAAAIAAMLKAAKRPLKSPLHLALSYDEEIGCMGVRSLIEILKGAPHRPAFCIVGEPTGMAVASGHKGKTALTAHCHGEEGHSALAPLAMNALHLAADMTNAIREKQAEIAEKGRKDGDYDVPYTTLHVGRITGGEALNIVPNQAEVAFEIRNLAEDSPAEIIADLKSRATRIANDAPHPCAKIEIAEDWSYPGLLTPANAEILTLLKSLTRTNSTIKVAFGTEGGLFDQQLGIPSAICGPGSMMQGHKADEFVSEEQLAACDTLLTNLSDRLENGL